MMKRSGDFILAALMLLILSPLLLVTAVLIKIDSRGPVIFSQERVGQNGQRFWINKFRSMVVDAEKKTGPVWAREDDDRITRVGQVIRKLRIDEIPQLWNVLKGEMSFVGPRPERAHFIEQLVEQIPYYSYRLSVKPGVTGWAQVCYGYGSTIDDAVEKLNYDLFYIKNLTFLFDVLIVFRTVKTVLFGKGAR
jgi:exopolysaccharide biosynthesis polyprenyl glycosylphosphotransferase